MSGQEDYSPREGSPQLSVKKQLRLQKMALMGINYKPKDKGRIFETKDMKEFFRSSL